MFSALLPFVEGSFWTLVALVVFVCAPLTLLSLLVLAATPWGRFFCLPVRAGQPWRQYLPTLLGLRSPHLESSDWSEFEKLLAGQQVQVRAAEEPSPFPRVPAAPADPSPAPSELPEYAIPRQRMVLAGVGVGLMMFMLFSLLGLSSSSSSTAMPIVSLLSQSPAYFKSGEDAAAVTVPLTDLPAVLDRAVQAGFAIDCPEPSDPLGAQPCAGRLGSYALSVGPARSVPGAPSTGAPASGLVEITVAYAASAPAA